MNPTNTVTSRTPQPLCLEDTTNVMPYNVLQKTYQVIYNIVSYSINLVAELFGKNSSTALSPSSLLHQLEPQTNQITFAACSIAALYPFYSSFFDNPALQSPHSMPPSHTLLFFAFISVLGLGYLVTKSSSQTKKPSPILASLTAQIKTLEDTLRPSCWYEYNTHRKTPATGDYNNYQAAVRNLENPTDLIKDREASGVRATELENPTDLTKDVKTILLKGPELKNPTDLTKDIVTNLLKVSIEDFNIDQTRCWGFFRCVRAANNAILGTREPEKSPQENKDTDQIAQEITDCINSLPHDINSIITLVEIYNKTNYGKHLHTLIKICVAEKFPESGDLEGYRSIVKNITEKNTSVFLTPIIMHLSNYLDAPEITLCSSYWKHLRTICSLVANHAHLQTKDELKNLMFGKEAETT